MNIKQLLMTMKRKDVIPIIIIFFILVFTLWLVLSSPTHSVNTTQAKPMATRTSSTQVLTKAAVEDLVTRAANQKYLQDVFAGNTKMPALPPVHFTAPTTGELAADIKTIKSNVKGQSLVVEKNNSIVNTTVHQQRCHYQGQDYLAGDIVKSAQGWLKCTPTISVIAGNNQPDALAWTADQ